MKENIRTVDMERDEVRIGGRGGSAFLITFGSTWLIAATLALLVPLDIAALIILFQGAVGTPVAFVVEKLLGDKVPKENALTPLLIQASMSQLPAFLAVWFVYTLNPFYVPAALAAVVGGHFIPYVWIHRSRIYAVMGVIVALVPFLLMGAVGEGAFYVIGFFVGLSLIAFALTIRLQTGAEAARRSSAAS